MLVGLAITTYLLVCISFLLDSLETQRQQGACRQLASLQRSTHTRSFLSIFKGGYCLKSETQ